MDSEGLPLPPWRMYDYWPTSMGWRMGGGEEYMIFWGIWSRRLDAEGRRAYRRRYRPPLYWFDFYWDYADTWSGLLLQIFVACITLPVRIPAYFVHGALWPVHPPK